MVPNQSSKWKVEVKKAQAERGLTYVPLLGQWTGFLGDTAGTVQNPAYATGYVFVRGNDGSLMTMWNQRVPFIANLPIIYGYTIEEPKLLQVISQWTAYSQQPAPNLPNHHFTHEWPGTDTVWVHGEQVLPWLVRPTFGVNFSIDIFPGLEKVLDTWVFSSPITIDLTSHVPATGARFVAVILDATGTFSVIEGTPVDTPEILTGLNIPKETTGTVVKAIVRLFAGQGSIRQDSQWTDIFDPRWASGSVLPVVQTTLTYYLQNTASDVATYKKQLLIPFTPKTTLSTAGLGAGNTVLQNFITDPGNPGITHIPAGQFEFHVHAAKTAGTKTTQLYAEVWEANSSGVDIAKIGTTEVSAGLTGVETEYSLFFATSLVYVMAGPTSRITLRVFASVTGGGSAPTVAIYYGDEADSRLSMPTLSGGGGGFPAETPYRFLIVDGSGNVTTSNFISLKPTADMYPIFGAIEPPVGGSDSGIVAATGDGGANAGRFYAWYMGTGNQPGFTGVHGRGSISVPDYLRSGDILQVLRAAGYGVVDGIGTVNYTLAADAGSSALWSKGELRCIASADWSADTSWPTRWEFWAVPAGSTAKQLIATLTPTGFDIPTGSIYSINGSNFLSSATPAAIGTAAAGTAVTASHSDHVHATGAGTPSTQAFGDAAATGTGPAAAMTDHKHGMPAGVLATRNINTTAPITGGGNLSADRTIAISAATPDPGGAAGSMSSADKTRINGISGWDKLGEVILAIDTATLDLSGLSPAYRHLKILIDARSTRVSTSSDPILLKINNDGGNNYVGLIQWHANQQEFPTAQGPTTCGFVTASTSPANWFCGYELTIPNYSITNYFKNWQCRGMQTITNSAGNYFIYDAMGQWLSTVAIAQITILPSVGPKFLAGSYMAIYGIF